MKDPRNVLWVVLHAEVLLDPLADQRTGPDTRRKSRSLRSCFNDPNQLLALLLRKSARSTRQGSRAQTLSALSVVPCDPLGHSRTIDLQLCRHRDRGAALGVPKHGLGAAPHREILENRCFAQQIPEPVQLTPRQPRWSNGFSVECSSHDKGTKHSRIQMESEMMTRLGERV